MVHLIPHIPVFGCYSPNLCTWSTNNFPPYPCYLVIPILTNKCVCVVRLAPTKAPTTPVPRNDEDLPDGECQTESNITKYNITGLLQYQPLTFKLVIVQVQIHTESMAILQKL